MATRESTSRNYNVPAIDVIDPVTQERARPSFLALRPRVTTYDQDDRLYLLEEAYHWAQLGRRHLADARAWWAIADLSNVVDTFDELESGMELRVPSISRYLFSITTKGE